MTKQKRAHQDQPDLFGPAPQAPAPTGYVANPERIRGKVERIVSEIKEAEVVPWDYKTLLLYKTIVPQMVNWLPDDEAKQWVATFEAELIRLGV